MNGETETEMPRYRCHKEVHALKIACVGYDGEHDRYIITPADEHYAPFSVEVDYIKKHNPVAGGYYVVYQDGYTSFSPAEAFESGYSRIE